MTELSNNSPFCDAFSGPPTSQEGGGIWTIGFVPKISELVMPAVFQKAHKFRTKFESNAHWHACWENMPLYTGSTPGLVRVQNWEGVRGGSQSYARGLSSPPPPPPASSVLPDLVCVGPHRVCIDLRLLKLLGQAQLWRVVRDGRSQRQRALILQWSQREPPRVRSGMSPFSVCFSQCTLKCEAGGPIRTQFINNGPIPTKITQLERGQFGVRATARPPTIYLRLCFNKATFSQLALSRGRVSAGHL